MLETLTLETSATSDGANEIGSQLYFSSCSGRERFTICGLPKLGMVRTRPRSLRHGTPPRAYGPKLVPTFTTRTALHYKAGHVSKSGSEERLRARGHRSNTIQRHGAARGGAPRGRRGAAVCCGRAQRAGVSRTGSKLPNDIVTNHHYHHFHLEGPKRDSNMVAC